jgi:hypothetical protein
VDVNDPQARSDLQAYAKEKFPDADAVRLLDDDFDREIVGIVQLKFHGARVKAGFSRELWERTRDFGDLRAHMERHNWRETVNHAISQQSLLGESGWLDWK